MGTLLQASYGQLSDVLYVSLGSPVPSEADGEPDGIELAFAVSDGAPCGASVIGYRLYGWDSRLQQLSARTGAHLKVDPTCVEAAARTAMSAQMLDHAADHVPMHK
ncbi:hypothetical protein [Rhodopila globiformis]|uniref:Uncharacterized protein n=1 Tax=Rhodopila globiformis TaxID=1071 RepID=A0A2S6N721_RHOGL|nr:hypothetical protein [Rhodopila globiformis]PPQ30422.1 hypothetical protein CCS01_19260 [Rhodopila globiformis]